MHKLILIAAISGGILTGCNNSSKKNYHITGEQSRIIIQMIDAVNNKNPEKYVSGFANHVQVFVDSALKIEGRENLKWNRATHFKNHPDVRSEIQHLVEIDHRVILHDKVWLNKSDQSGQNMVEIFTFENGEVSRVDVIQPKDLFKR